MGNLFQNAESLADTIHELTKWSKSHPNSERYASASGLLKLPPVFTAVTGDKTYRSGLKNLVAMIKVLDEYEEGLPNGDTLILAELPTRYNFHGGQPRLAENDLRKVHNWLQQVAFAVRAAVMEQEQRRADDKTVPDRVVRRLYANKSGRKNFVTFSPDNRYELKPLRDPSLELIHNWVAQEHQQKCAGVQAGEYGAKPTRNEWDMYGLAGQIKALCLAVSSEIDDAVQSANDADQQGRFAEADKFDSNLQQMALEMQLLNEYSAE